MKKLLLVLSLGILLFWTSSDMSAQRSYKGPGLYYMSKGKPHKTSGPFVRTNSAGQKEYFYRVWYYNWQPVRVTKATVWNYYNGSWYSMKNCTGSYWTYSIVNKNAKHVNQIPPGGIYSPTKGH